MTPRQFAALLDRYQVDIDHRFLTTAKVTADIHNFLKDEKEAPMQVPDLVPSTSHLRKKRLAEFRRARREADLRGLREIKADRDKRRKKG